MSKTELESIQEKQPANFTKRMLELCEAWPKLKEGTITPAEFEDTVVSLKDSYLAMVDTRQEPSEEMLWKQYELHSDLYKHYLEVILKFNVFYYAVTGAILSFYFTKSDTPVVRYALLFPILMSIIFGSLFSVGAFLNRVSREDIFKLRNKLMLDVAPELNVLGVILALSAIMMFCVAVALLYFFFPNLILPAIGVIIAVYVFMWLMFR